MFQEGKMNNRMIQVCICEPRNQIPIKKGLNLDINEIKFPRDFFFLAVTKFLRFGKACFIILSSKNFDKAVNKMLFSLENEDCQETIRFSSLCFIF